MLLSLASWLQSLGPEFGFLRVVQYITFRAVLAASQPVRDAPREAPPRRAAPPRAAERRGVRA